MSKKRLQREERLLEVAEEHFVRYGYRKSSVDDIVREVGIAKGTFYLHFKSKDELLEALLLKLQRESTEEFVARMMEAQTPTERLRTMISFTFEAIEKRPLLLRLMVDDPEYRVFQNVLSRPQRTEEEEQGLAMVRAVLQEGIAAGEFREDLDMETFPFLIGSFKLLYPHISMVTGDRIPPKQFLDGLIDMAMQSISVPKKG